MWDTLRGDKCGKSWIKKKKRRLPYPEKALLLRRKQKKHSKNPHRTSQWPWLPVSVSWQFSDEAYLTPFYIYTTLHSNSFMNKINYFSKQKLILFFSAWLTQDLSTKSLSKIKPILPFLFAILDSPSFLAHFCFSHLFFTDHLCNLISRQGG